MPDENALTVISFLFAMPNSLLVIELNHDVPVKSPSRIRHLVSILINQTITNTNTGTGHRAQALGTGHRHRHMHRTQAQG